METPLGCKQKRKHVLSHASVEAPTGKGDYHKQQAALRPGLLSPCFVPQDVE
jgi:hypothetical protein